MSILSNKYIHDLRTFPGDARLAWERRGAAGVWREFSARTVRRVYERTVSVVLDHDLDSVVDVPVPDGIHFTSFTEADEPALARVAPQDAQRRLRVARERGREVTLAWRGNAVVGWAILSFEMADDLERYPVALPPATVYGWHGSVISGERGRGTGAALVRWRGRLAREMGATRMRVIIERHNDAALRMARRCFTRSRVVGEVRTLRFLRSERFAYRETETGAP